MALSGFHYKYDINGSEPMVLSLTVATGVSFDENDILEFDGSGLVQLAAAGSTRIAGVAVEGVVNAPAGTKVQVLVSKGAVYRVTYTPGTKTNLAGADRGVAFDLKTTARKTIDLDDVTAGMCIVVDFNNTEKTADVLLKSRLLNQ